MIDAFVFIVAGAMCLAGALGVVLLRNPVHNALSLVLTLFGVAVLFVSQEAHFLAVVQVIVYAGAIVVLFLFVIMLLGVDKAEQLSFDSLTAQRPAAAIFGVGSLALIVTMVVASDEPITGARATDVIDPERSNVSQLAISLFEDFVYAFELTSVLLVIAVIGAVVLAAKQRTTDDEQADV
ncbi:MAG: NADH-quinone oxidoreductase subunit J [Actinomycetota bacterium]